MTKVLAFCDYFEPPMGGGAEIVSAQVYERLVDSGDFSVTVVTGVPGRRRAHADEMLPARGAWRVVRSRGIELSKIAGAQVSFAPGLPISAWRALKADDPDVIHVSSIHFFGSFLGAAIAAIKRIPLVTTCHLSGVEALPARTRRIVSFYERTFGRFILKRSKCVIAVSEAVRDHVVSLGVDPSRVEVVGNGVDSDRFQPGDRDEDVVRIAYVGRLIANKGPLELIDALALLDGPGVHLQIVGDGPLQDEVLKRAADDGRIDVLGHREDVHEILGRCDIFARPSATEGRSLAILEAMAAGCAVVASDIPANAELVEHGRTGLLVPPGDSRALRDALALLIDDPPLREQLAMAARETARCASWDTTSIATGEVLRAAGRARAT